MASIVKIVHFQCPIINVSRNIFLESVVLSEPIRKKIYKDGCPRPTATLNVFAVPVSLSNPTLKMTLHKKKAGAAAGQHGVATPVGGSSRRRCSTVPPSSSLPRYVAALHCACRSCSRHAARAPVHVEQPAQPLHPSRQPKLLAPRRADTSPCSRDAAAGNGAVRSHPSSRACPELRVARMWSRVVSSPPWLREGERGRKERKVRERD